MAAKSNRDLVGLVLGDITVVAKAEPRKSKTRWLCKCRCGAECLKYETHLVRGISGTCRHKVSSWPEWASWEAMHDRVNRKSHESYHRYGGRGITICERWDSFLNFYEDMGKKPSPDMTLDRYPNKDGNYEPGNCRWATRIEQQNNLSTNRVVVHNGESLTLAQLARKLGVNYRTIYSRHTRRESLTQ